jgi:hypothetical protein
MCLRKVGGSFVKGCEEMGTNDAELVEKEDPFIAEISPM